MLFLLPTCTSAGGEVSSEGAHIAASPSDTRGAVGLVNTLTLSPVHRTLLTSGTRNTTPTHIRRLVEMYGQFHGTFLAKLLITGALSASKGSRDNHMIITLLVI